MAAATRVQGGVEIARVPDEVSLPVPPPHPAALTGVAGVAFRPPAFGVTVLGSSHGFDPAGTTSGYILWINHRGIMIDPPPNSAIIHGIPHSLIEAVIVTHCHADHDAGAFQKILQARCCGGARRVRGA